MPKQPKYSESSIYKLCCKDPTIKDIYVGSTTNFRQRKGQHKHSCTIQSSRSHNYRVYKFIRDNGGWGNWDMIEIEKYNAKDKRDLERREREHMENLGATLNQCIPTRTDREYYDANKDHIIDKSRKYYSANKDAIKEKGKAYRAKNRDVLAERSKRYYEKNKESLLVKQRQYHHKNKERISVRSKMYREKNSVTLRATKIEYYNKHKQKLAAQNKKYREINKDRLRAQKSEKIVCDCGLTYTRGHKSRHLRTKRHLAGLGLQGK